MKIDLKKVIISIFIVVFGFTSGVWAKDVMPIRPNVNQVQSVGLYQVNDDIKIYEEPNEDSQILYRVRWNNEEFFPDDIGF